MKNLTANDVTTIIPYFNRQQSIAASVASALANGVREVLIVDDASPEAVPCFADERVRVIRHRANAGAGMARNTGAREAAGRYLAFLDSDDVWRPGKIKAQLRRLENGYGAQASSTGFSFWRADQEFAVRPPTRGIGRLEALTGARFGLGSTLLVERATFLGSGGFDAAFRRNEDWDWLLRFTRGRTIATTPEILADVHLSGRPVPATARESLDKIRERHFTDNLSPLERQTLRAALHWERSAAFAWEGRHGRTASELLRCFASRPGWTVRALGGRLHGRIA